MGRPEDDFDDDNDNEQDVQPGSAAERFRKRVAEIEQGDDDQPDETDEPEVRVEPNADGEDEVIVPLTRKEKKAARGRLREEAEAARRENIELRERLARLEGEFNATRRREDVRDETDDESEFDRKMAELQDAHTAAYQALVAKGARATQEDKDAYNRRVREIDKKKTMLAAEHIVERRMASASEEIQREAIGAQMRSTYADVYANPRAVQYAEGEYRKLVALGQPQGPETVEKAMAETRRAFRMVREPAPSAAQKARLAGPPRGRAGSAPSSEPESIRFTKEMERMADAMYPHITDRTKRLKAWAAGPGRRYAAETRNKG